MSWNHRVILHKAGVLKENPKLKWDEYLAIHEVYYNDDGNPRAMTVKPIEIIGGEGKDSLFEIKWTQDKKIEALNEPILEDELTDGIYKEIEKEKQNEFSKSIESKE